MPCKGGEVVSHLNTCPQSVIDDVLQTYTLFTQPPRRPEFFLLLLLLLPMLDWYRFCFGFLYRNHVSVTKISHLFGISRVWVFDNSFVFNPIQAYILYVNLHRAR
jgi:hypothetical protein